MDRQSSETVFLRIFTWCLLNLYPKHCKYIGFFWSIKNILPFLIINDIYRFFTVSTCSIFLRQSFYLYRNLHTLYPSIEPLLKLKRNGRLHDQDFLSVFHQAPNRGYKFFTNVFVLLFFGLCIEYPLPLYIYISKKIMKNEPTSLTNNRTL